jgi:hypothetical protein
MCARQLRTFARVAGGDDMQDTTTTTTDTTPKVDPESMIYLMHRLTTRVGPRCR